MKKFAWLAAPVLLLFMLAACTQEESTDQEPFIILKTGNEYTSSGDFVPVGGKMTFGISAVGGGAEITNFRVRRTTPSGTVTEMDKGLYIAVGGLDTALTYTKNGEASEIWSFFIQNANRDTAIVLLTVYKGEGSAYGPILHYPSITLGLSENATYPHFLNLSSGEAFTAGNVAGHEAEVDLVAFHYFTSGLSSPTLSCPGYTSALTYYPEFSSWPVKNMTTYDYHSVDNDLVSLEEFTSATNDSLLVLSYNPQSVSGLCKFCYTGKIVPFKTSSGKYGLIHVIRADEENTGSVEIEVKIQQ